MSARGIAYYRNNPARKTIEKMVYRAVKRGELQRPLICPQCGCLSKIEAHHSDYSKPLEVTWLCRSCHMEEHRRLRGIDESAYLAKWWKNNKAI